MLLLAAAASTAHAASTLRCENPQSLEDSLVVPIALLPGPGDQVTGIQFDVVLNPTTTIKSMELGAAAAAAGKSLSSNAIGSGRWRVIIAGLNQTPIESGVILTAMVESKRESGGVPLGIEGVVLSDPRGTRIPTAVHSMEESRPPMKEPPACGCGCNQGNGSASQGASAMLVALAVLGTLRERVRSNRLRHTP